jgi:hypothetical protein
VERSRKDLTRRRKAMMRWAVQRWGWVLAVLTLAACAGSLGTVTRDQALDNAWRDLEPHTSSHDLDNWEVIEAKKVTGREVAEVFERDQPRCVWPTPQPNEEVESATTYWYVEMKPRPATPLPGEKLSPTAPPRVPEPFVYDAFFLVDPSSGEVVARMLHCVIY